jgi:hypothetical protein
LQTHQSSIDIQPKRRVLGYPHPMDKQRFLVCYELPRMSGLWGVMDARSKAEIHALYPELAIVDERPDWMSDDDYRHTAKVSHLDIDDPPSGLLNALVADRGRD